MIEQKDTGGHSKSDVVAPVPFSRTIRPLVIAPAGAFVVLSCYLILSTNVGDVLIWLLVVAPFVYAVEILFVVPILWLWPQSRRPSVTVGGLWGAAASLAFILVWGIAASLTFRRGYSSPSTVREWKSVALLCLPGIASGVLFAYFSRKD